MQKLMVGKIILKNLPYSWCETKRSPLYKTVKLKENSFLDYRLYDQGVSTGEQNNYYYKQNGAEIMTTMK